jgi:hypothetical protein
MDEQQKCAILLSTTILAARKVTEPCDIPSPARDACIANAISNRDVDAENRRSLARSSHPGKC